MSDDWTISSERKLTDEETSTLQDRLRSLFQGDDQDDVDDIVGYAVAMVTNHKDVNYVVQELNSMGLDDLCPPEMVQKLGKEVCVFLQQLKGEGGGEATDNTATTAAIPNSAPSRIVSIKSKVASNALTMAGALGASREGGRTKKQSPSPQSRKRQQNRESPSNRNGRGRGSRDRDGGGRDSNDRRDERGRAFDRLTKGRRDNSRKDRNNQQIQTNRRDDRGREQQRQGRGGRGFDDRGARGGRGGRFPNEGGRGGRGSVTSPRGRVSGTRREREELGDEPDFVPAGRGRARGRGYDREGRGRSQSDAGGPTKRIRTDEGSNRPQGYIEGSDYDQGRGYGYQQSPWRGRGFRGGRSGRGRSYAGRSGRGQGGEGSEQPAAAVQQGGEKGGEAPSEDASEHAEAAVGHPSPVVAAAFGRGYGYRGRGRSRGFGRGYHHPARAEVKSRMASMTWVRKKDDGDGGDKVADEEPPSEG